MRRQQESVASKARYPLPPLPPGEGWGEGSYDGRTKEKRLPTRLSVPDPFKRPPARIAEMADRTLT